MQWIRWLPHNVHVNQELGDTADIADAPFVHLAMPSPVHPERPTSVLYQTWSWDGTDRRLYVHDEHGRQLENSLFADNVSKYTGEDGQPIYPLAVWRDDEVDEGEFFLPARASWWAEQRYICRALMAIAYAGDYQLYSIPVLKNWSGEDVAPSLDPAEPLVTTNPNAGLEFVTPSPNISAVEAHVESSLRRHAVTEGLPAGIWSSEQTAKNLSAMRMEFQALNERREEHISDYSGFIRDTWKAHKAVANHHRPGNQYDKGVELKVRWMPIPLPRDDFQHSQTVSKRLEHGLTHQVDELMGEHNIGRTEAERLWIRNLTTKPGDVATRLGIELPGDAEPAAQMNGAQISAASLIIQSVAEGTVPRDSGIGQLTVLVGMTEKEAERAMGTTGTAAFQARAPGSATFAPKAPDMPPAVPSKAAAGEGVPRPPDVRDT